MGLWSNGSRCPQVSTRDGRAPSSCPQSHPDIHSCPHGYPLVPRSHPRSSPGSVLDARDEVVDLVEDEELLGELTTDLLAGVHDRGVIAAAEHLGDLRVAVIGELAEHVHADLTGVDERPAP